MAFYRKLTEGWRLGDGILPESLLEKPMGIYEALRGAGRVPDAESGLNALECEWISMRRWTYSLSMEAPGEDDERVLIELPKVAGSGCAYLNGEKLGEFSSGAVRLELTGALRTEGENRLEIRFEPSMHARPEQRRPLPEIGLLCAPILRAVNFATVENVSLSSRLEGDVGIIAAEFSVNAHTAGKYTFRYALSLDSETAGQHEIVEKLPAARRTIRHEIKVGKAVLLDRERLDETVYGVKFTLERGGVGCDVRHMETAFREGNGPMRCMAVGEWPVSGDTIDRLTELGADGMVLSGMPDNAFEKNDFLMGLTVVGDGERVDAVGLLSAEKMKKCAAGEAIWPMDSAMWKLRGGDAPAKETFGMDADRFAKVMRYRQAAHVLARTEKLRREKRRVIAQADEDFAYLSSSALMERDGEARPALSALKYGWQAQHAFCELPEGGRAKTDLLVQMNVWALVEALRGSVLTVSARVLTLAGEELAANSFPVMGGDVRLAGVISLRTPVEEGLLIVRTELSEARGGLISRTDGVLAVGENAVKLLGGAERAQIGGKADSVRNEGKTAALSAYVCLLPGEETEKTKTEWLNA